NKKKKKNKGKHKQGSQDHNSNNRTRNGNDGGSGNGNTNGGTPSEEESLLGLINTFRAQNNQSPLTRNGKLDTAALNHSQDMANRTYLSHTSPEGSTPDQRILAAGYSYSWWGENIYQSAPNDASAQAAFNSWVNSSGHRANMLSNNYTQIGIGRATAANGRTYWTNTFGKPA
ncbi:MAG: CAP domain-containing protein, partial [Thermomicrobiales bacterium]|nr:CAP domain-containing protein [Thermomicrobiales bacterium]